MKTALALFKREGQSLDPQFISQIEFELMCGGVFIDKLEVFSQKDASGFKRALDRIKDGYDALAIAYSDFIEFDIKEIIAQSFNSPLIVNQKAKDYAERFCMGDGALAEEYALMPLDALVLPNEEGAFQGFILDEQEFSLIYMPDNILEISPILERYVTPFLESKLGGAKVKRTLKYFGDKQPLLSTLYTAKDIASGEFDYYLTEKNGDITVSLIFEKEQKEDQHAVLRFILSNHQKDIYAEQEESLATRVFDILRLNGLKISVAESFTAGRIVAEIINNSGASKVVHEGVVAYSNQSKIDRLSVSPATLSAHGAVSQEVAYEMARGLLANHDADIAISTTGIAGPRSDDTLKPVGLCYIGIATKNWTRTYKFNFTGTREEITETAKNNALFLAIKNIKKLLEE